MNRKRVDINTLAALGLKLPGSFNKIGQMLQENPDFRKMCEEYQDVAENLNFWVQIKNSPTAPIHHQIKIHRELLRELKQEIFLALEQG